MIFWLQFCNVVAGRKRGNRLAGQWQASIEREMGGGTDRSCLTKKGKLGSLLDGQWGFYVVLYSSWERLSFWGAKGKGCISILIALLSALLLCQAGLLVYFDVHVMYRDYVLIISIMCFVIFLKRKLKLKLENEIEKLCCGEMPCEMLQNSTLTTGNRYLLYAWYWYRSSTNTLTWIPVHDTCPYPCTP